MYYKDGNRFTEDERDAMDGLARVVAFVCEIDYTELKSKTRRQPVVDARKIASKYAYDNIPQTGFMKGRNVALAAWYFNVDHSSITHAVQTADELYEFNPAFAKLYDTVIEIVDNPKYEPDISYHKLFAKEKTWDSVRMGEREFNKTRYAFMPQYVKEDIINYYNKGYGELSIANKVGTTMGFIQYFIKREGLKKDKIGKIRRALGSQSVKFGFSKSIAY